MSRWLVVSVAILALGRISPTLAQAATIYACVARDGTIRIVASPSCKGTETLLSWNQIGPQGPQGPIGPTGPERIDRTGG